MTKNIVILLICVFALVFSLPAHSKNANENVDLVGYVSAGGSCLEFANVVLLNMDSTFCSGCMTDSLGKFHFKDIQMSDYILKVSFVGFNPLFMNCNLDKKKNDIGKITLNENTAVLKDIVITAVQPKYTTQNGKLITNVANTDLKTIGSLYDLLENTPGINIVDDKINIFGKGEPIIYINNRKIIDKSELDKLRSTDIKNIELIYSPDAKYNADGRAVVRINLNRNLNDELSFQAISQVMQGKYTNNTDMLSFSFKKSNFNIFANYNYAFLKNKVDNTTNYTIHADTLWDQTLDMPLVFKINNHVFSTGIDWDIKKGHAIGTQFQGKISNSNIDLNGYQTLLANNILVDSITTNTQLKNEAKQYLFNIFYEGEISKNFKLNIFYDYLSNNTPSTQVTNEIDFNFSSRELNIKSQSEFTMSAVKAMGTLSFDTNKKLEFGADYSNIDGDGYYMDADDYIQSNVYSTLERKAAAFFNLNSNFGQLGYSVGLRYEYSKYNSTEDENEKIKLNREYHNIFPFLSLQRKFNDFSMSLSFSRKIRRPSFSDLNSNNLYLNRYLIQKGDPYLNEEDIYNINYLLGYKFINFNLGYTYIKDPISVDFEQSSEGSSSKSLMRFTNYPKFQKIDLFATVNYSFGCWKPVLSIGLTQPFFDSNYLGESSQRNKPNIYVNFNNDFKLFGDFIASINCYANTDNDLYITESEGQKRIDLRFRKSFLNKQLMVMLTVRDLFNLEEENNKVYVGNYCYNEHRNRNNRYVSLSLQYNFNAFSKKYRGKNVSNDDLKRF